MISSRLVVMIAAIFALSPRGASPQPRRSSGGERVFWGFTGPWDRRSDASLRAHGAELDAVVTGWITLDSATAMPVIPSPFPDTIHTGRPVRRLTMVTSWHRDRFHPRTIRALAGDGRKLAAAAARVARHARAMRYDGIVLDFEAHERADRAGLLRVMRAFTDSAHARGVPVVAAAIPASDGGAYPTREVLGAVDLAVVMLYDQHWSTSEPGPIASPDWVRGAIAARARGVDPSRLVAALPTYGYWWKGPPGTPATDVGHAEAVRVADSSRTRLDRDRASRMLRARRAGEWELWVSDAPHLQALIEAVAPSGVHRFALWRLGLEDPAVWAALRRR